MAKLDTMRSEKKIIIQTSRGDVMHFLDARQEPHNKRMQQTSLRDATDE